MPHKLESIFVSLRAILQKHASRFSVTDDTSTRYCLEGRVGPATLRAWGGKLKRPSIPIAWVEIGKSYVSYHLMAAGAADEMSKELRARMQGKTCFNFKAENAALFQELERVTARGLAAFAKAGFISE